MMKRRILIGIIALVLVLAVALPVALVSQATPDPVSLTLNYTTTAGNVSSLTVNVSGDGYNKTKTWVNGTYTFTGLKSGKSYTVTSSKYAATRTDSTGDLSEGSNTLNVPCADLTVKYKTLTGNVSPVTAEIMVGGKRVAKKTWINGEYTFKLLKTQGFTYEVKSSKYASTRTDTVGALTVDPTTFDVPVTRFRVMVVKSDFTGQRGVTVEVRIPSGRVEYKTWVSTQHDVSLLASSLLATGTIGAGPYDFKATKGASTAQTAAFADPPPGLAGVILMIP